MVGAEVDQCGVLDAGTTISTPAEATSFATCSTYLGSIAIATDAAGAISISGTREVVGGVYATDVHNVTAVDLPNVRKVRGSLSITRSTSLASLSFPMLSTIGSLSLWNLPSLTILNLTSGVYSAESVFIGDTSLKSLEGFEMSILDHLSISNNTFLSEANFSSLEVIQDHLYVQDNPQVTSNLSSLNDAGEILLKHLRAADLPELWTVSSLTIQENAFQDLHPPKLFEATSDPGTGTIDIVDNPRLVDVQLPALRTTADHITIKNNSAEADTIFTVSLPILWKTNGLKVDGPVQQLLAPNLTRITGMVDLSDITYTSFDCSPFDELKAKGRIEGTYSCSGVHSAASLSKGAKIGISIGIAFAVLLVVTIIGLRFRHRRRQRKVAAEEQVQTENLAVNLGLDSKVHEDQRCADAPPRYELRG